MARFTSILLALAAGLFGMAHADDGSCSDCPELVGIVQTDKAVVKPGQTLKVTLAVRLNSWTASDADTLWLGIGYDGATSFKKAVTKPILPKTSYDTNEEDDAFFWELDYSNLDIYEKKSQGHDVYQFTALVTVDKSASEGDILEFNAGWTTQDGNPTCCGSADPTYVLVA